MPQSWPSGRAFPRHLPYGRPGGTGPCRRGHLVPTQRRLSSALWANAVESGSHGPVRVVWRGQGPPPRSAGDSPVQVSLTFRD